MCFRVHRHIRAGFWGHVYCPSEAIHLSLSNTFVVLHANNKFVTGPAKIGHVGT